MDVPACSPHQGLAFPSRNDGHLCKIITGGFVPAIHAAASMMEAGKGGDKEEAKAAQ